MMINLGENTVKLAVVPNLFGACSLATHAVCCPDMASAVVDYWDESCKHLLKKVRFLAHMKSVMLTLPSQQVAQLLLYETVPT